MSESVIILGAGASGLMAAYELASNGVSVIVLEARDRLGGRIHTIYDELSGNPIELGAEFVHGTMSASKKLIKASGVKLVKAGGEMWHMKNEKLEKMHGFIDHWDLFKKTLRELKTDRTINEFLQEHFADDKYESLRESVRMYASGYDSADPEIASAMALGKEWLSEAEEQQYRTSNGYQQLINFLAEEVVKNGGRIYTGQVAKELIWLTDRVTVKTEKDDTYSGKKIVITLPISVLTAEAHERGAVKITPELPAIADALKKIGIGAVIKIHLRFNETFWLGDETRKATGQNLGKLSFIFSEEVIPTWWTQYPNNLPLLTGWLGGPDAEKMKHTKDEDVLESAMGSLANIFRVDLDHLWDLLMSWKVVNWTADPYTRGSYSYSTVDTELGRKVLVQPIDNTLYFAGEALYDGPAMGTVEAALSSGQNVAEQVMKAL